MSSVILDRTSGDLVLPDGTVVSRPAVIMGADAATIMRHYFHWALGEQLEPELYCATCYDGTLGSKATYQITESEIQIICACSMRFFRGSWLPPLPMAASTTNHDDVLGIGRMQLSTDVARLLRLYKRVLAELGLREALRCNACFALNLSDGCDARVNDASIEIVCRCTRREYVGVTL